MTQDHVTTVTDIGWPSKPCSWTPAASCIYPNWYRISRRARAARASPSRPSALTAAEPHARRELDDHKVVGATTDASRGWLFFDLILEHAGVTLSDATTAALAELHTYHVASNLWEYVPDGVRPALRRCARAASSSRSCRTRTARSARTSRESASTARRLRAGFATTSRSRSRTRASSRSRWSEAARARRRRSTSAICTTSTSSARATPACARCCWTRPTCGPTPTARACSHSQSSSRESAWAGALRQIFDRRFSLRVSADPPFAAATPPPDAWLRSLDPGPAVLERHRAVEDRDVRACCRDRRRSSRGARTGSACPARRAASDGSSFALVHDLERLRVEHASRKSSHRARVLDGEQPIVEPHLGVDRVRGRHPVQRRLHLAAVGRVAAARRRIVRAAQLDDLAGRRPSRRRCR